MFYNRNRFLKQTMSVLAPTIILSMSACQSSPASYPNQSAEIQQLEKDREQARADQLDVLAPKEFNAMSKNLDQAKEALEDNEDTREDVADAQDALNRARERSAAARVILTEVLDARSKAIAAGADTRFKKDFKEADADLKDDTEEAAKGDVRDIRKHKDTYRNVYQNLEVKAIVNAHIGESQEKFRELRKKDAEDEAPETYRRAQEKLNEAERIIAADRYNQESIQRNAAMAKFEVDRLEKILADSKRLNSERSAIELWDKEQQLHAAQGQTQQLEGQLADLDTKYRQFKEKFTPEEADVLASGNRVIVRLKSLRFETGKADLPADEASMMKLVEVLRATDPALIRVEGHTDATGGKMINARLSQQRAEAVKNFLVEQDVVEEQDIFAEGFGDAKPLATNKTKSGRAQNRRVDVIISAKG